MAMNLIPGRLHVPVMLRLSVRNASLTADVTIRVVARTGSATLAADRRSCRCDFEALVEPGDLQELADHLSSLGFVGRLGSMPR